MLAAKLTLTRWIVCRPRPTGLPVLNRVRDLGVSPSTSRPATRPGSAAGNNTPRKPAGV